MAPTAASAGISEWGFRCADPARRLARSTSETGDFRGVALEGRERALKRSLWRSRSNCEGMDVNLFFDPTQEALAVEYCRECPVRVECLKFVLEYEDSVSDVNGVFGGTTPAERLEMRGKK